MTADDSLILPIMICAVGGAVASRLISRKGITTPWQAGSARPLQSLLIRIESCAGAVQRDQRVLDGIIENIGIGPLRPRDAADHGHAVAQHQLIGARSPAWATAIARVRRSSIAARSAANSLLVRRTRHAIAILPRADAKQQSHAF